MKRQSIKPNQGFNFLDIITTIRLMSVVNSLELFKTHKALVLDSFLLRPSKFIFLICISYIICYFTLSSYDIDYTPSFNINSFYIAITLSNILSFFVSILLGSALAVVFIGIIKIGYICFVQRLNKLNKLWGSIGVVLMIAPYIIIIGFMIYVFRRIFDLEYAEIIIGGLLILLQIMIYFITSSLHVTSHGGLANKIRLMIKYFELKKFKEKSRQAIKDIKLTFNSNDQNIIFEYPSLNSNLIKEKFFKPITIDNYREFEVLLKDQQFIEDDNIVSKKIGNNDFYSFSILFLLLFCIIINPFYKKIEISFLENFGLISTNINKFKFNEDICTSIGFHYSNLSCNPIFEVETTNVKPINVKDFALNDILIYKNNIYFLNIMQHKQIDNAPMNNDQFFRDVLTPNTLKNYLYNHDGTFDIPLIYPSQHQILIFGASDDYKIFVKNIYKYYSYECNGTSCTNKKSLNKNQIKTLESFHSNFLYRLSTL